MYDSASLSLNCSACNNSIEINKKWTPGGVNDYGGWILKCNQCSNIFECHIGRDVMDSDIISGATKVDMYDDEMNNKTVILKKYNLT